MGYVSVINIVFLETLAVVIVPGVYAERNSALVLPWPID
jgi:hypothetical protein